MIVLPDAFIIISLAFLFEYGNVISWNVYDIFSTSLFGLILGEVIRKVLLLTLGETLLNFL